MWSLATRTFFRPFRRSKVALSGLFAGLDFKARDRHVDLVEGTTTIVCASSLKDSIERQSLLERIELRRCIIGRNAGGQPNK